MHGEGLSCATAAISLRRADRTRFQDDAFTQTKRFRQSAAQKRRGVAFSEVLTARGRVTGEGMTPIA